MSNDRRRRVSQLDQRERIHPSSAVQALSGLDEANHAPYPPAGWVGIRRCLGHEGGAFMNGISALITVTYKVTYKRTFSHCSLPNEDATRRGPHQTRPW